MTKTYQPNEPIWCAGCGHYGVRNALLAAFRQMQVESHQAMVLAGIGCAGTLQNNVSAYGYHALHGRVLPAATGAKLANPRLDVIAVGGDGDGYAIGCGHLIHSFKRNPGVVYILMNNGTYGLTKGQHSPTADAEETDEQAFDGVQLGLSIPGSGFIARGSSASPVQLQALMVAAMEHTRAGKGFAFLEVLSPCVTYNDTYPAWAGRMVNVDALAEYDCGDRIGAFTAVNSLLVENRFATGLIFKQDGKSPERRRLDSGQAPLCDLDISPDRQLSGFREIMAGYGV
ncbi:MAG: 2-oxoacid:ferredoxin oxidoreductase subunit beta [Gammaproteobacteria bacterium]|nr:2-oxoacid:ferredoxin oxidoreductase subunit beta [Gammaproteobacteria bacterium]